MWFQQVGGAAPAPGVDIPSGAFVAKITNDAREDEMEENMEQVYTIYQIAINPKLSGGVPKKKKWKAFLTFLTSARNELV